MAVLPVLFITLPMIHIFACRADAAGPPARSSSSSLYMLVIPATVPSVISAYSVVGEREQGTLEPVLTTPIRREEFLLGKALAAFVPTLVIAYVVFGIFLAVRRAVRPSRDRFGDLQRARCAGPVAVHAAAGGLGDLGRDRHLRPGPPTCASPSSSACSAASPPLIIVALMSLICDLRVGRSRRRLAAALLAFDLLAWRVVAAMFDRERLIAGAR